MRWVFYLDLDAYYVSCERRDRPELEGQPVIVGPDPKLGPTRGVVLSASYEARKNGVHSAMPASRAAQLCPEAIWVAPDFEKYSRVSEEVRGLLRTRFEKVVPLSIDEAAMQAEYPDAASAEARARAVQEEIRSTFRLPCSIGVAAHRTVAKIATDEAKPAGVKVVPPDAAADFLAPLSVRSIPGVGPKTEELLAEVGVHRIGELRSLPPAVRRRLGHLGEELYRLARGEPLADPEEEESGPRSRSADRTFFEDTSDVAILEAAASALSEELAGSLAKERLTYRTVSVGLRWEDFQRTQRSRTLPGNQEGPEGLRTEAIRLLRELVRAERAGQARRVRTLSVGAERLSERVGRPVPLDSFPSVK